MEIKVPTIAERKAARRASFFVDSPSTQVPTSVPASTGTTPTEQKTTPQNPSEVANTLNINNSEAASAIPPRASESVSTNYIETTPTASQQFTKDDLIQLARSMGLEVTPPKRIWIKHSFSITPESKERFQNCCKATGIKMQDALEEALQDWFSKVETKRKAPHPRKDRL